MFQELFLLILLLQQQVSKSGNLTFHGLITDLSNAISFGNNSITTIGLASAGSLNVSGTTTITGQTNLSDSLNVTGNIVVGRTNFDGAANMNNGANVIEILYLTD